MCYNKKVPIGSIVTEFEIDFNIDKNRKKFLKY